MNVLKLQNISLSCLAGAFLALTLGVGLTLPAAAQSTTGVTLTAKGWNDPATGNHCWGDGVTDDTQCLQDLIDYAIAHQDAVSLEPGIYLIKKTILIQTSSSPLTEIDGFHLYGQAGANANGSLNNGGVTLKLAAGASVPTALLEVGQGTFRDMSIENIGLISNSTVEPYTTQYGLLFGETEFSGAFIHNVTASYVDTAFGVIVGTTGGANGEFVNLLDCGGDYVNCFYANSNGQAYQHRITNCQASIENGGTYIKIGNALQGHSLDVISCSCSFTAGSKRNTFLENDGVSGDINVTGGRVEHCDTALYYGGGGTSSTNSEVALITIRGVHFTSYSGSYPLIDNTLNSMGNAQWTNTFDNCRFDGPPGNPPVNPPMLSVGLQTGDRSKNYFEKCVFWQFGNQLQYAPHFSGTNGIGGVIRDCSYTPWNPYSPTLMPENSP